MVRRQKSRRILASFSLFAFMWVASGGVGQLVYCIGSDGHAGIEHSHDGGLHDGAEQPAAVAYRLAATPTDGSAHAAPCTDVPLLLQASKQRDDSLGNLAASATGATPVAILPQAEAEHVLALASLPNARLVFALRTTILRV